MRGKGFRIATRGAFANENEAATIPSFLALSSEAQRAAWMAGPILNLLVAVGR